MRGYDTNEKKRSFAYSFNNNGNSCYNTCCDSNTYAVKK